MSLLELKGSILESISQIDDESQLMSIHNFIIEIEQEDDGIPEELRAEFDAALSEMDDESQYISHEEVMKRAKAKL